MTSLILGTIAAAVMLAVLVRGEISHRSLTHDLAVSAIGIAARDARLAEQERLLRAIAEFKQRNPPT